MPSTPNTSATGGWLRPSTAAPSDDLALDTFVQGLIAGITGLSGDLVLPRVQEGASETQAEEVRIPDVAVTWVAVGVTATPGTERPALIHSGAGEGSTTLHRHLQLSVLASFYGPRGNAYAEFVRDGLHMEQNREELFRNGFALTDVGGIVRVPELVNTLRRRRSDLSFRLRRHVKRTYPVLNLKQANGVLNAEGHPRPPWTTET